MGRTILPNGLRVPRSTGSLIGGGVVSVADSAGLTALAATLTASDLGLIALLEDSGAAYVYFNGGSGAAFTRIIAGAEGLSVVVGVEVPVTANTTTNRYMAVPGTNQATLTKITAAAAVTPVSALGTITLAVAANPGFGTNLLSAATFDAETLVAGTPQALTLTATTADLTQDDGIAVRFQVVSNNGDAVGGPIFLQTEWTLVQAV